MANTPSLPTFPGVLVPNALGPLCTVGSLAQEQAAYAALGWTYSQNQIPNGPPNAPGTYAAQLGPGQDVHGDFEADDLWQNLVMYKRTGNILYRQMAELWANYYLNHYENDLSSGGNPDSSFGYDHLFGYGLIDWFEETWDLRALAAAVRLGNISLTNYHHSISLRTSARHMLLALRLWEKTGEQKWRNHAQVIRDDLFNPAKWPQTTGQPNSYDPIRGVWMLDREQPNLHVTANAVHLGWINFALARFYEATGGVDTVVREQLIKMARFVQNYGLNPADGQSGAYIAFDTGTAVYFPNLHAYTTYWVDTLARGFILTGDTALKDLAATFWGHGTDAATGQVGHFMNKFWLSSSPFYLTNGDLSYSGILFSLNLTPPPPPPPPPGHQLAPEQSTITPGSVLNVAFTNNPSNLQDWIGLYRVGAGDGSYLAWKYLNNLTTTPTTPKTSGMITLTMPGIGQYECRMFANNTTTVKLATSGVITVQTESPPPPPPSLTELADNTWQRAMPVASQRYIPRSATPSDVLETQAEPVGRSYSGCFYLPSGKVFYFGGAHGSYPGNDVEVYDIAANAWTQQYKPEVCALSDGACNGLYSYGRTSAKTPLGRPYCAHVYQQFAWDPVAQKFIGTFGSRTWAYEPVAKTWTELLSSYPGSTGGDISTLQMFAYDLDLQSVLFAQTATEARGLYKWTGSAWQFVVDFPADINAAWLALYSTYIPDLHVHLVTGNTQTWKFQAPTLTWTPVAALPANVKDFDYDTRNKVVIAVGRDTVSNLPVTMWAYDPVTDVWTSLNVNAPAPMQNLWSGGLQLLRYDSTTNLFIYLAATAGGGNNGGTVQTWGYRYKN